MKKIIIYTDGGSRGNPGPAASGFVLKNEAGEVLVARGDYLGIQTNNFAEYTALIKALEQALILGAEKVELRMDSQLIVMQMTGKYKIKHPNIIPLASEVVKLLAKFKSYSFQHVPREQNTEADAEVNKCLDALTSKSPLAFGPGN